MFDWFRKSFLIGFLDTIERSILEISIVLCTPIFIEKILMKEWAAKEGERQRHKRLKGWEAGRQGGRRVRGWRGKPRRTRDEGKGTKDEGRKEVSRAEGERLPRGLA